MTDKERLKEIKEKYNFRSIDRFVDVKLVNPQELKWLIEQAELVGYFARKNRELNEFLNKYIEPKHLGKNVIDVAMDIIVKQSERVQELEDKCNYLSDMNEMLVDLNGVLPDEPELYIKLKKENKRYRKTLEAIYELAEYNEYDNTLDQVVSAVEKALEKDNEPIRAEVSE